MIRHWILIPLLILSAVLATGCNRTTLAALQFNEAPWRNGEVSEYSMSNSAGEPIGTARFAITAGVDAAGGTTWNFQQDLLSAGDEQLSAVEMHADTLRPTVAVWTRTRPQGVEMVKTTYNGAQADMELTSLQNVLTQERVNVPSDVRDEHTIAMLIRALPLASGYATPINTYLPVVGITERTEIIVADAESMETPAGAFDAWRVNLTTETSSSVAWISQAAPYPLLKLEDDRSGVIYELVNFQPGT